MYRLPYLIHAIETEIDLNIFIWVLVPGGIIAGKLVSHAQLNAIMAAERPIESPGDQANLDHIHAAKTDEILTAQETQAAPTPDPETFLLLYPRLFLGSTEIQPCQWIEIRLDAVSAWGHGFPPELSPRVDFSPLPNDPKLKRNP